jgi:two-component system OmpR family response regulator
MRFLVVEDDPVIAGHIAHGLGALGSEARCVASGAQALAAVDAAGQARQPFDAIVLDRMLPDTTGIALLGQIRSRQAAAPVLMLSAMVTVRDRIDGLRAGADDYLTKPFDMAELAARLDAIARRGPPAAQHGADLAVGRLRLDPSSHAAVFDEAELRLNRKLFSLLAHLMRHADRLVTRAMLLEHVWGYTFAPTANIVEANVSRLRAGLLTIGCEPVETLRGQGYILRSDRCA